MTNTSIDLLRKYNWLFLLLISLLLYGLGAAMARYLGASLEPWIYLVGQIWVIGILFMTYFLRRYFDNIDSADHLGRMIGGVLPWKSALLIGAAVSLTAAVAILFVLIRQAASSQALLALMIAGIFAGVLYGVPPLKLAETGFGALLISVMLGAGVPTIAFLLLNGDFHRFLPMSTFPIGILNLVMLITFDFPSYGEDVRRERRTLVTEMGWRNAIYLHNLLILSAFLLIGVTSIFGFPTFAAFPPFLLLPLGIFQIYMMLRVASGQKPNWTAIILSGVSLFSVLVYILTFSFWTH